uniref:Melanoma inhibitory activity protein 3 n=1 Tax=Schistosoma haematobium TaxID=6185 RepID=A0A094ZPW6_SCHHA
MSPSFLINKCFLAFRMKIYLAFLLIGFGALLCHNEAIIKQHLPTELLCSDINCLKTITTGSLIKDVNVPNKKTLKVNTLVDIIGLSADATNSMMKIKFGEEHLYIDPSFVQIKDSVSSRKFLKVKNFDINLNPSTLLDERTLNLVSPYQLPSDEDLNYKSTEKISEKDHPYNKQALFRNQRQSNAYDTRERTNEIDEMDVVSSRSYDQVSKQETTYKIDSDEVEQDDKIEEDNDDNEFDYNNSSEIKHGDTDTTDYPSESPVSYSTSSSDILDNDSHIESNMSNSHFSLHDRKQGVITSDLIGVQDIGIIYSSDVNSSILSSVSRKVSEDQIIFNHHSVPVHLGLIQCIYWAANASFDKTYSKTVRSPFSRFLVNGFRYFFAAANVSLQYLPGNIISNLDNFLLETFSLSVNFIIAWMIFIFHLIFMWNLSKGVHSLLSKYIFSEKCTSPSLVEYLKLEEYSIQLASQLSDTEESNSHLSKWANSLSCSLQNLQEEYTSKLSEMTLSMDDSRESFIRAQSELNHLKNTHNSLEQNLRLKLTDKEEVIHELNSEINRLKQLHSENDDKWKKSLLDLEESNRKSIEELKEEQEQLYSQANLYYNRMKTMQSEVDKILESRKASEEKLLIKEAEFQSLLATFNTLKGLEVIFEQESSSKQETNDMEEREVTTTDNLSNVSRTLEDDVEISDKSSIISESALCDLIEVDEKTTEKSRLQKNLSLLLDVGRLHAQIRLKDEQIKAEESKAKNEHDLRVEVESKMEEIERENSTLKANLIHIEQERNAYQTKLDILSCYFKERELELQRDLGKHVVVGSESSEALMHSRKRNQELEGEVKVLRDQMAALRRELVETERTSRRQISELDKRSHENWLAARASDHQIQDLREENFSLRQKLIESENNALRSSMRTIPEKINSSSREKIMNIFTRPILPLEFMKNPSLRDVRSQSRNSLTNLTSKRPVAEANPFPFIPTAPRGTMPFSGGLQRDVIPTPTRPLLPGFPPVQMSFPSAFLAPPFAPVMKAMTDQNNKQNSSPSSVSSSLK